VDADPLYAQTEHAAVAMSRIVMTSPKPVRILLLGPQTNLAMAVRLQPLMVANVESVVFMGGAHSARGNAYDSEVLFKRPPVVPTILFCVLVLPCVCVLPLQNYNSGVQHSRRSRSSGDRAVHVPAHCNGVMVRAAMQFRFVLPQVTPVVLGN
jgi:hypothetical protein